LCEAVKFELGLCICAGDSVGGNEPRRHPKPRSSCVGANQREESDSMSVRASRSFPLPKMIVDAWTKAGVEPGWVRFGPGGHDGFSDPPFGPRAGDIPGFIFFPWREGVLAKLPPPQEPFGLEMGNTEMTDVGLKELARLQHLRSLSLGGSRVTDAGLKELAGL